LCGSLNQSHGESAKISNAWVANRVDEVGHVLTPLRRNGCRAVSPVIEMLPDPPLQRRGVDRDEVGRRQFGDVERTVLAVRR
jgi:hypothetical protein